MDDKKLYELGAAGNIVYSEGTNGNNTQQEAPSKPKKFEETSNNKVPQKAKDVVDNAKKITELRDKGMKEIHLTVMTGEIIQKFYRKLMQMENLFLTLNMMLIHIKEALIEEKKE